MIFFQIIMMSMFSIVFGFIDVMYSYTQKLKLLYLSVIVMILVVAYFNIPFSGDFLEYKRGFDKVDSFVGFDDKTEWEPGFVFLIAIVKFFLTTDADIGISILTLLGLVGLLVQFPKYTKYPFVGLLIYITHFYWWYGNVLIRQTLAMVILFPVFQLIAERKFFKSILLILFASLFHISALIFIVFIFFNLINFQKLYVIVVLIITTLILGLFGFTKDIILTIAFFFPRGELLEYHFNNIDSHSLNPLNYLESFLLFFIAYYYKNEFLIEKKIISIGLNLLLFSILFSGILFQFDIVTRFLGYFTFFGFTILIPALFQLFKSDRVKALMFYIILCLYFEMFLIRFLNGIIRVGALNM